MVALTIILLCVSSALADISDNYYRQGDSYIPVNTNQVNNINSSRYLHRPSNSYYNFEQRREDQPPQVEIRDEDMGKYMNKKSTTNLATPTVPSFHNISEHLFKNQSEPMTTPKAHVVQNWNQIINKHLPANMPPPPSTPKWMDLSESYNQPKPLLSSRNTNPSHKHAFNPSQPHAFHKTEHVIPQNQYHHTVSLDWHLPLQPKPFRGNHKFNWHDIDDLQEPVTTNSPIKVPTQNHNAPFSVPTLSPWSGDNFGK
ncbi:uncharacterized protein LOC116413566 [Galleria mellonella]|uniref:Uncharacterized protein LOC116413566 n=1 Tax=Galleria mellonella TaxID=7137 RepID=A0ABM3MN15_GALME|nr:uncharacterized protein LOC116413566 [Galleria mellonella]